VNRYTALTRARPFSRRSVRVAAIVIAIGLHVSPPVIVSDENTVLKLRPAPGMPEQPKTRPVTMNAEG
jgi:hypothetical protein